MKNSKRIALDFTIIFASFILTLICISCGSENKSSGEISSGTPVEITHPFLMNIADSLNLNGNTVFLTKEIVRSTFPGFIVEEYKNIGDKVEYGDTLLQIKTQEYSAADTMKLKLGNQFFQGTIYVRSHSSGILTELDYHKGDFITTGEQIAVVSDPSSLRIKLNVPYEDVLKVKLGNKCVINLPDGVNITGIIDKNVPSVDAATQTQTYFVRLSHYHTLPENLNLLVKIPFGEYHNSIVLPKSCVMTNVTEDSFWVMKLINDTTAVRVDVKKGIESDSVAQILSPKLSTFDKIVLTGAYGLPDTAAVKVSK
jgi:biotin carboxyl carrier protein